MINERTLFRYVPYFAIESITDSEKADQHKTQEEIQQCLIVIGIVIKCHFKCLFIEEDAKEPMIEKQNKKEPLKDKFFRIRVKIFEKKELCRKDYNHAKGYVMIVFPVI